MINEERLVNQFLELVNIDSVSFKEKQIFECVEKKLLELGASVTQDNAGKKIGGECGNLIAKIDGEKNNQPVLLNAHLDTVQSTQGLKPMIKNRVIYTDGSTVLGADDKSGIIVILEAVRALKENKIPHPPLELVFTVAEEQGLMGSANLDYNLLEAKSGYAIDGSMVDHLVIASPAKCTITFVVHGVEAHAGGEPEKGIHAIRIASDAVSRLNLGKINDITTANISSFIADYPTNIVPGKVVVKGEVRSTNDFSLHAQVDHMIEIFLNAIIGCSVISNGKKLSASLDYDVVHNYKAYSCADDQEICKVAFEASKKVGLTPKLVAGMGGSDANHFNNHGINVLRLCTGTRDAHSKKESIPIDDMVKSTRLLVQIMKQYN